jgi:hypothetical protein
MAICLYITCQLISGPLGDSLTKPRLDFNLVLKKKVKNNPDKPGSYQSTKDHQKDSQLYKTTGSHPVT